MHAIVRGVGHVEHVINAHDAWILTAGIAGGSSELRFEVGARRVDWCGQAFVDGGTVPRECESDRRGVCGVDCAIEDIDRAVDVDRRGVYHVLRFEAAALRHEDRIMLVADEGARRLFGVERAQEIVQLHVCFGAHGVGRAVPDLEMAVVADRCARWEDDIWHEAVLFVEFLRD